MRRSIYSLVVLGLVFVPFVVFAGEWSSQGNLALESRAFQGDGNALTKDYAAALSGTLEVKHKGTALREQLRVYGIIDQIDPSRSQLIVEEAWVGYRTGALKLKAGAQLLNWTATEAFHPADILNSRNYDSNIENAGKLGEPMVSASLRVGDGSLTGYYMPVFVNPFYPQPSSRLSFASPGANFGSPLWAKSDGSIDTDSLGHQFAFRFTQNLGDGDLGIHFVKHQDRTQPLVTYNAATGTAHPVFAPVTQVGGTYQHVLDAWVFKAEVGHRIFDDITIQTLTGLGTWPDHTQAAFGIEYGWVHDSGSESTLLFEGQSVFGASADDLLFLFQKDLMIGYRFSWNDVNSKELLATFIFDVERSNEYLFNFSYSQRLSDTWSFKPGLRVVYAPPKGATAQGLELLHRSNYAYLNLIRYF